MDAHSAAHCDRAAHSQHIPVQHDVAGVRAPHRAPHRRRRLALFLTVNLPCPRTTQVQPERPTEEKAQQRRHRPRSRAGFKLQIPDFWITSDPKHLRPCPGLCGYCTRRGTRLLYGRDKISSNTTARNTVQKWEHGHVPGTNCTAVPPPVWNFNPARLRPRGRQVGAPDGGGHATARARTSRFLRPCQTRGVAFINENMTSLVSHLIQHAASGPAQPRACFRSREGPLAPAGS